MQSPCIAENGKCISFVITFMYKLLTPGKDVCVRQETEDRNIYRIYPSLPT